MYVVLKLLNDVCVKNSIELATLITTSTSGGFVKIHGDAGCWHIYMHRNTLSSG